MSQSNHLALVVSDDATPALYADVKAFDVLAATQMPSPGQVRAIEKGHRVWPDGMTEDYERIEFS